MGVLPIRLRDAGPFATEMSSGRLHHSRREKPMVKYLIVAVVFAATLCCASGADAIPAFARRYQTDCSSCHTIFPERNQFGEAFARNGFFWPGAPVGHERPHTGYSGETDASTPSHGVLWPATLPDFAPVSFLVEHDMAYNAEGNHRIDADTDTGFAAFTAGSWRGRVGWWGDYDLLPDRKLGEAYLQLRLPTTLPLFVKGGRFEPQLSLWKADDTATIAPYGYNEMTVGDNPFAIGNVQHGVQVSALFGQRIYAVTGVTFPDGRRGADWYGHVSARFGGTDLSGEDPPVDLERERLADYLSLTVGAFGYVGSAQNATNDFYRSGVEVETTYKRFTARLNGTVGRDENPAGAGTERSSFFMAQGQYLFPRQVLAAFRYEYQHEDTAGTTRRYIPSLTYAPWQNLRLALEYVHEAGPSEINREGIMRASFAF